MRVSQQIGWSQESKLIYQLIKETDRLNELLPGNQPAANTTRVSRMIGWSNEANLYYEWLRSLDKLTQHYGCPDCTTTTTTTVPPTTTTTTTAIPPTPDELCVIDPGWVITNLNVTTYRNGDPIPEEQNQAAWDALTTGAWCSYNNNPANDAIYGKLYNWYAVNDARGLAPVGYHIPDTVEWTTLIDCLGFDAIAGGKMREAGSAHWTSPNSGATNSSGFTALGAGIRNTTVGFTNLNDLTLFWASNEQDSLTGIGQLLPSPGSFIVSNAGIPKEVGGSVRVIQD